MTDPVQNNPSTPPLPHSVEPWSMEQDADHLMDDLFANVDVLLEGSSSQLPHQLVQTPTEQLPTVPVTATAVAPTTSATPQPPRSLRTRTRKTSRSSRRQAAMTWQTRAKAWRTQLWAHFDKVCFGVACVSLGGAVVWFVHQSRPSAPAATSSSNPNASDAEWVVLSPEDAQFAQYMLRSLRVIGRQPSQVPATAQGTGQIPTSANSTPSTVAAAPQVIERIYIPVYPPTASTANSSPPSAASAPNTASAPNAVSPPNATGDTASTAPKVDVSEVPEPLPRVPAPNPLARRSAALIPRFEKNPVREPAVEPERSAPDPEVELESAPDPPQNSASQSTLPMGDNKLVGIIQAGDRTTVLFKIGDTTQRVKLGEEIGSSGWTLVSAEASNQSAVIRRNGAVHSITSDQSF